MPAPQRPLRLAAFASALLLVAAGGATVVVSYEAAERVVHPEREVRPATPAGRGLAFERVAFDAADGVPLVGWWIPAADARGTVIFLHGYTASKSQALSVAPFLVRAGYNVLAFDLRAHGESGGAFTTLGLAEKHDVRGALAYLRARGDPHADNVALFGWSMGAATALHAAPGSPEVRAVIADSSFARLSNVVSEQLTQMTGLPRFPFVPLILLFASQITGEAPGANDPAREAERIGRPILVIQGARDELARPDADGAVLARAAGAWADLWLVEDAGHVGARRASPREYESRVTAFLAEHLSA